MDRFDAVAAELAPLRAAAQAALDRRQQAWQPLAEQLRSWAAPLDLAAPPVKLLTRVAALAREVYERSARRPTLAG